MEKIYTDATHPASYGGVNILAQASKQPKSKVSKFLNAQPVYRTFKTPKRRFKRAQIRVSSLGVQFQADLFDLQKMGPLNSGYKWILLVVDSFSRLVTCEALKNKTGEEVARGMDVVYANLSSKGLLAPRSQLATDLGSEFYNKSIDVVYSKYDVVHVGLRAPKKAAMAEIHGRYVLGKLYKIMKLNANKRWIDSLDAVVIGKNKRKNPKTAGLSPSEINFDNQKTVHDVLYKDYAIGEFTLQLGDRVQIVKEAFPFAKSFHGYYSERIFYISKLHEHSVPRYSIVDESDGESICGTWYAQELYKV